MKKKFNIKEIFNWRNYLLFGISLLFLTGVFLLVFGLNGWSLYAGLNGSFVAGCLGIAFGAMSFVTNAGFFDVISVGFANLIAMFKKNPTKKYPGIYEYRELKTDKRRSNRFYWIWYLLSGIVFLIAAIVIYVMFYL